MHPYQIFSSPVQKSYFGRQKPPTQIAQKRFLSVIKFYVFDFRLNFPAELCKVEF